MHQQCEWKKSLFFRPCSQVPAGLMAAWSGRMKDNAKTTASNKHRGLDIEKILAICCTHSRNCKYMYIHIYTQLHNEWYNMFYYLYIYVYMHTWYIHFISIFFGTLKTAHHPNTETMCRTLPSSPTQKPMEPTLLQAGFLSPLTGVGFCWDGGPPAPRSKPPLLEPFKRGIGTQIP